MSHKEPAVTSPDRQNQRFPGGPGSLKGLAMFGVGIVLWAWRIVL